MMARALRPLPLLLAGGSLALLGASVAAAAPVGAEPRDAVVYIIGTVHAPTQLRSLNMSPGHVRAALKVLDPDVVCVESNSVWFAAGQYFLTTWEAYGVAVPWARERGRPVYGVDWLGRPDGGIGAWYLQRLASGIQEGEELLAIPEPEPLDFAYGLDHWLEPSTAVDLDADYAFHRVNGDQWLPRNEETGEPVDWGALQFEFATLPSFTHERDRNIARFIDKVVEEHPGARIAVVYGAGHRGRLSWFLRQRGIAVRGIDEVLERYPAGDVSRFEELLTPRDAAAILLLAWDGTTEAGGISSERAALAMERLEQATDPDLVAVRDYLRAREAMLRDRRVDAEAAFRRIVQSGAGDEVAFPFQGNEWRLYLSVGQAARLELGRLADLAGRRAEAVGYYGALLQSIVIPEERDGYQSNARFRYLARAHTAVRALLRSPYRVVTDLAHRTDLTTSDLVRVAMRANRAGEWDLAVATAERALESDALEPGPRVDGSFARATALAWLGRLHDAREALAEVRKLYDARPSGHHIEPGVLDALEAALERATGGS